MEFTLLWLYEEVIIEKTLKDHYDMMGILMKGLREYQGLVVQK